jgi:hypothetical protein
MLDLKSNPILCLSVPSQKHEKIRKANTHTFNHTPITTAQGMTHYFPFINGGKTQLQNPATLFSEAQFYGREASTFFLNES